MYTQIMWAFQTTYMYVTLAMNFWREEFDFYVVNSINVENKL